MNTIVKIKETKEVEIRFLQVEAGVRYWEDATINGEDDKEGNMPCRNGDYWCPFINVKTGQIVNWSKGLHEATIHYKVCDEGTYTLIDHDAKEVLKLQDAYVPSCLSIGSNGYGDYIIMEISKNGFIKDWKFKPSDFEENEQD
jgi:hypothetical protein